MSWNPLKSVKKFVNGSFNNVKKYALNPTTWITGGVLPQLDLLDKGLQHSGADLFGNKQQKINNDIARENNQLQQDSYNFNKNMAEQTFAVNKDVIYNGSQIKSADMAKAGLNPLAGVNSSPATISASNVASPNLSQPDLVSQTGLQKIQTIAGLAMQAKQLQSSLSSSAAQNKSINAQTRYQELVNDYFKKHGVLPTQQNEWIAQLLPLLDKKVGSSSVSGAAADLVEQLDDKIQNLPKQSDNYTAFPHDKAPYNFNSFARVGIYSSMKGFSKNEKDFLDWCKTKKGQLYINKYGRSSLREYFFDR